MLIPKQIILDRSLLKLLASDTRIDILKKLEKRKMTVSELSRDLNLAKATVHEHLERMSAAGIINCIDNGHKWTYYELTPEGRSLVRQPPSIRFMLVLSFAAAAACVAGFVAIIYSIFFHPSDYLPPAQGGLGVNLLGLGLFLLSSGIILVYYAVSSWKCIQQLSEKILSE